MYEANHDPSLANSTRQLETEPLVCLAARCTGVERLSRAAASTSVPVWMEPSVVCLFAPWTSGCPAQTAPTQGE